MNTQLLKTGKHLLSNDTPVWVANPPDLKLFCKGLNTLSGSLIEHTTPLEMFLGAPLPAVPALKYFYDWEMAEFVKNGYVPVNNKGFSFSAGWVHRFDGTWVNMNYGGYRHIYIATIDSQGKPMQIQNDIILRHSGEQTAWCPKSNERGELVYVATPLKDNESQAKVECWKITGTPGVVTVATLKINGEVYFVTSLQFRPLLIYPQAGDTEGQYVLQCAGGFGNLKSASTTQALAEALNELGVVAQDVVQMGGPVWNDRAIDNTPNHFYLIEATILTSLTHEPDADEELLTIVRHQDLPILVPASKMLASGPDGIVNTAYNLAREQLMINLDWSGEAEV